MAKKQELEARIRELEANQGKTPQQTVNDLNNLKLDMSGSHPKKAKEQSTEKPKKGFTGFNFGKKKAQDPTPVTDLEPIPDKVQEELIKLANEPDEPEEPKKAGSEAKAPKTEPKKAEPAQKVESADPELEPVPATQEKTEVIPQESTEVVESKCEGHLAIQTPRAVDCSRRNGPGKAYKYWDPERRFWRITEDFWVARQANPDLWDVVWVWYENGQIARLMTPEEMQRYLP